LDVSTVGMSFPEFLYYADFPFSLECWVEIDEWLSDLNYFKFLMWVDKNVFRTKVMRDIFPEYLRNIKKYTQTHYDDIKTLYEYWKNNNVTYQEFEEFYYKNT
jgi:hypothetical protein